MMIWLTKNWSFWRISRIYMQWWGKFSRKLRNTTRILIEPSSLSQRNTLMMPCIISWPTAKTGLIYSEIMSRLKTTNKLHLQIIVSINKLENRLSCHKSNKKRTLKFYRWVPPFPWYIYVYLSFNEAYLFEVSLLCRVWFHI